jgi:hypothetical protein
MLGNSAERQLLALIRFVCADYFEEGCDRKPARTHARPSHNPHEYSRREKKQDEPLHVHYQPEQEPLGSLRQQDTEQDQERYYAQHYYE